MHEWRQPAQNAQFLNVQQIGQQTRKVETKRRIRKWNIQLIVGCKPGKDVNACLQIQDHAQEHAPVI